MIKEKLSQHNSGKIDFREFISIFILVMAFEFADMTPTIFFEKTHYATWMIPIGASIIVVIPFFFLLSLLKKYKDKNLIEITYALTGKYIGFILALTLFIIGILGIGFRARNYSTILNILFFPKTPLIVLLSFGMIVCYIIANRGLEAIGRVAWIFLFGVKAGMLLAIIFSWKNIELARLHPIWGGGIRNIIGSSFQFTGFMEEIFYFAMLYPFVRGHKEYKRASIIGLVVSTIELAVFFAIYIAVFDYPSISIIPFPFQQLTMLIETERFLINLETIFLSFWIIAGLIRFSLYLYLASLVLGSMLKVKEHEPLLLPLTSLIIFIGLVPKNEIESLNFLRDIFITYNTWIAFLSFPIILWIIAKLKKEGVN